MAFLEVLRYMEKQNTTVKQSRAFKRFIRDYGTHYISSAYMGSKVAMTSFYTNYERLKYGKERLFECSAKMAEKLLISKEKAKEKDDKKSSKKSSKKKTTSKKSKDDEDDEDEDENSKDNMGMNGKKNWSTRPTHSQGR